jgi:hypothetical protein
MEVPQTPYRQSLDHLSRDQRLQVHTLQSIGFLHEAIASHFGITIC